MRITNIKTWLVTGGVYLKIETDEGFSGYGDATNLFMPQSVYGMLRDMMPYLIGENPMRIEYIWQSLFRDMFMRGGPSHMAAISGVDMALYDLKGKILGIPAYELLGGLVRDRIRLYGHVSGKTPAEMAAKAKVLADTGCTMIRFRAFHDTDDRREFDFAAGVSDQLEYFDAVRSAIGNQVDLIVECHGRYDLPWAVRLAKELEKKQGVFFMEDPLRQENPAMMAALRSQTCIPLATGERCHHRWDFRELFTNQSINYARPDICHCGGITEFKNIASFAQTYGIAVVPHNTQGPLGMAACMHAAFTVDNIAVVEAAYANPENRMPAEQFARHWPDCADGYSPAPKGPGLGVDVDENALDKAQMEFQAGCQPRLRALDGSVRDW
ncbi:MAG: galactonate dehydratase [Oscillospiraceae bacterium]|nr:galactonate dehydratase [Oscillospiraceae bacterium]